MEQFTVLLGALVPLVLGTISQPIAEFLFKLNATIDRLAVFPKRVVVVVIAFLLTSLAGYLNAVLPESLALFDAGAVEAALAAGYAMVIHKSGKA